jgi:lysylphosphatidylglycerol synthase-like protein
VSLEPNLTIVDRIAAAECGSAVRRKVVLSVIGALVVTGILAFVLAGRRGQFVTALHTAPISLLALAALLQIVALLARSEAWNVCVRAAGGSVPRRLLFRAAGVGYLASVLNGSVGMAARIAALRRVAGDRAPRVPALVAAEVPIITVEVVLAAVFSFTLIAALGIPWWVPAIAVAVMGCAVIGLRRVSECRQTGLWAGLAVLRGRGRGSMVAFTLLAVGAQVARNWLMLHAIGVDLSVFAAMAWLIAMFTLGQLPVGPSSGPAAAVLILGAHGVAATTAAGVLLGITSIAGSLCYAAWAIIDQIVDRRRVGTPEVIVAPVAVALRSS